MACTCEYCGRCNGTGHIWVNFDQLGRVIEDSGIDDLSDLEECPECDGRGILQTCEECIDSRDDDD